MKRIWTVLSFLITAGFSLVVDLPLVRLHYDIRTEQGFERIEVPVGSDMGHPGSPELPVTIYSYALPAGQYIKNVQILDMRYEVVPGFHLVYPVQEEQQLGGEQPFTLPDSAVYNSELACPLQPVIGWHSGNLRGMSLGQLIVCPFQYEPKNGILRVLKGLRVDIVTADRPGYFTPRRQTAFSRGAFERLLRSLANNQPALPPVPTDENPEDQEPTVMPSLLGPPVDMVIVTTEPQCYAYDSLSEFRKLYGINTTIRTMDWVRGHYGGIDDPERLRNFIKDAAVNWGTCYILLGGDAPEIPTRMVTMEPLTDPWPAHIAADMYYSDLDGDWDRDGDNEFGESEDSLDLYPDILVGRIPSRSGTDVIGYLAKERGYLFPAASPGFTRSLFISSTWWTTGDSRALASRLAVHLPADYDTCFINEGTLSQIKDSLRSDWGIIGIIGHGDVNLLRVKYSPRQYITNFYFDSLSQAGVIHPLMFVITCYTNPFQVDALGEHWVMNQSAGGIGYIGPTYSSVPDEHELYTTAMIDSIFSLSLAGALAYSKACLIPASQTESWARSFQFSQSLLGDPTLDLWDSIPGCLGPVIINHDTIDVGIDTVNVTLSNGVDCSVVYYKPGETFVRDSGFGMTRTVLKTRSAGWLRYAVNAHGFIQYRDSIFVRASQPHVVYETNQVNDSLGDGNGIINPGEDISLSVNLYNNGATAACSITAGISCPDTFLAMIVSESGYPDIAPHDSAVNSIPYRFRMSPHLPDTHELFFRIDIRYGSLSTIDTFRIVAQAPRIRLFTQDYAWRADSVGIALFLRNAGHQAADSILARIRSDSMLVMDSLVAFPVIEAGAITGSAPDSFHAVRLPGTAMNYLLIISRGGHEIESRRIRGDPPAAPDSLWAEGRKNSIILQWSPVSAAIGYRIYRARSLTGPYSFLDNHLVTEAYYEDPITDSLATYYYFCVTVDSCLNEGPSSDTVVARANPRLAAGWPVVMRGYDFSSPNYGDLDPGYPGLEIVVGGKDGCLYEWHCDGTTVTGGPLLETGGEIWSSPAVGDVNNDGLLEICVGVRGLASDNFHMMNGYGIPLPGWPRTVAGGVLTSPVLSDIDHDGDMEIFVISEGSRLYAFHYDGSAVFGDSCMMKRLNGVVRGTPAIGDINNDGYPEIACGGGGNSDSLYVWDHQGSYLTPFPIAVPGKMRYSPVLGDVCGDQDRELCCYVDSSYRLIVVNSQGGIVWQRSVGLDDVEASPVIANVAGSPRPEIVCGNNFGLAVYDSLGNSLPGFPLYQMNHNWKIPTVADLDADSASDIVCGSDVWALFGQRPDGSTIAGFPILMGGRVECTPAIADLDEDGRLELMSGDNGFHFYVFDVDSRVSEWPKFHFDQANTGCYYSDGWIGVQTSLTHKAGAGFFLTVQPNPFRKRALIQYCAPPSKTEVHLQLYDVTGRLVKTFENGPVIDCGPMSVAWDGVDDRGRTTAAGVYFLRFQSGQGTIIQKIIRVR